MSFWQRFHYQWQIRWISNICIFRYVFIVGQNHWDSQYKLAIRKLHGREIISNFCLLLKMHDYIKSCNIFSFTVWVIVSHNIDLNRDRVYRNHNEIWPCQHATVLLMSKRFAFAWQPHHLAHSGQLLISNAY